MDAGHRGRWSGKRIIEGELRAALTLHGMSSGGMGGGYGSPAVQVALCYLDELAWQQALWTYAQGRTAWREAWDMGQKGD